MVIRNSSPFGGMTRTQVLVALNLLERSYARELSRLLRMPVSGVQSALRGLERDGLVSARSVGRTRLFEFDPRYFALREIRAYLARLAEADEVLRARIERMRRRPRRTGKPL